MDGSWGQKRKKMSKTVNFSLRKSMFGSPERKNDRDSGRLGGLLSKRKRARDYREEERLVPRKLVFSLCSICFFSCNICL